MKLPSPQDLGMHPKFEKWRPSQEEMIPVMLSTAKRVPAVCAPTGSGKTAAYIGAALISGEPTCIVTESKGLQDQLLDDHGCVGLVDIRGRSNYECGLRPDFSCEDGYAARCMYKGTVMCPASKAEMVAATSKLVVTNYAKWTSAKKFGQGMDHFKRVIFDEGDQAPQSVESAMQVLLNYKEIEEHIGIDFPVSGDGADFKVWKSWAAEARIYAEDNLRAAADRLHGVTDPKPSWVRHMLHMRNLSRRLAIVSTASARDWVVEEIEKGFQFDPIRAGRYAEATLLLGVPHVIITSATLRPKTMFMLGLGKDDFSFTEIQSDFDPTRCPVYWVPTMRVDNRAEDLAPLWNLFDTIATRRRDRRSLVHTISYDRQRELLERSRYHESMLANRKGEPISETLEKFRVSAREGSILVSPSVGRGYDFPMDAAEWQFICKVPFPDGRSKILKARQDPLRGGDAEYGPYLAMQSLVQIVGRLMRSKIDRGESFMGDNHIQWFRSKFSHLAPKSFHMVFKEVQIVPPPPERL
jgi:Rad3-related DNA helicase